MRHDIQFTRNPEAESVSWYELSACEGKLAFDSFSLAKKVARRRMRNGDRREPYKCVHCGKFHIGSARNSRKKRIKEI